MFAACEPLRAKVELMEEFASVVWSIQAKVEMAWILPQAHKAQPSPIRP